MVRDIIHVLKDVPLEELPPTKRDVDKHLQSQIPDPALRAFVLTNLDFKGSLHWKIDIHTIAKELETLAGFPIGTGDKQYLGDVFFLNGGGQSKFLKASHMPTVANYFPNHMLTTIRGASHWVHAEAPDDVLLLLKKYLQRVQEEEFLFPNRMSVKRIVLLLGD